MGVLSQAALGGLAGMGQGLANVGQQQVAETMRSDEERRRAAAEEERQNRIDQRIGLREDVRAGRAGSSGSGSGRGGAAGPGALDIAGDPEKLALLGGVDRGEADEYVRMQKGGAPQGENVRLEPGRFQNPDRMDEAGPGRDQLVPKYTPGDAAGLRDRAIKGLYQAMKLSDPSHADDLSKSQSTDQVTGMVADYRAGDNRAGSAAMIGQGKPAYNEDGSVVSGEVGKGTVAEAKVKRDTGAANNSNASAGEHGAKTKTITDERDGKVSIKAQVAAIAEERKALAGSRADVKAQEAALKGQFGDDVDSQRRALSARRVELDRRDDDLAKKIGELQTRSTVVDDGGKPTKGKGALSSAGGGTATAASIKADFRAGKLTRAEAEAKLRSLGFD